MVVESLLKTIDKAKSFFIKIVTVISSAIKRMFMKTGNLIKTNRYILQLINRIKLLFTTVFFFLMPIIRGIYNRLKVKFDNNPELKKRSTYGLIFAGCVFFLLLCGGIIYMIAVFAVFCIMAYELLKMASNIEESNNKMFVYIRNFGLIYIALCCLSFVLIRESQQGLKISIWMFLTVWSVDIFAYIFGKRFGKIKFAPVISPNKTYEGAILGGICGMFVSIALYKMLATHGTNSLSIVSFFIFSLIVIILAQLSDLSESYIKRQCGVKDSGNILPGHGGLFDRFDSFLIVAPFIFIIVWLNDWVLF